jgi:hypothetical protein
LVIVATNLKRNFNRNKLDEKMRIITKQHMFVNLLRFQPSDFHINVGMMLYRLALALSSFSPLSQRLFSQIRPSHAAVGAGSPRKPILFRNLAPLALLFIFCSTCELNAEFSHASDGASITITGYSGGGGNVVIPSTIEGLPVTAIAPYAFFAETSITSVTIPNTITTIGAWAFYYCIGLTNVTIPASVDTIMDAVFCGMPWPDGDYSERRQPELQQPGWCAVR